MYRRRLTLPFSIATTALLAACSSTTAPGPPVTLLVTNASCSTGQCLPLEIRGFVPKFAVPGQPPAGFLVLGVVDGASACLTFPLTQTLTITGPSDVTKITWTTADPVSVTASNGGPLFIVGATGQFVPANASGWSVTFPDGSGSAHLAATGSCSP